MACIQQIKASYDSDFSEKEKTVSKGSQGYTSAEHTKHDHKAAAFSSQGGGSQAIGHGKPQQSSADNTYSQQTTTHGTHGGHGHQTSNHNSHIIASGNGNHGHHAPGHVAGHTGSDCNTHGHVVAGHVHNGSGYNTHGHQAASSHVIAGHGHNGSGYNTHGHQAVSSHVVAGHGHNGSGCSTHGHTHHKVSSQKTCEFEEKKKEYTSGKSGHKKVEKIVKKKSSCKSSSGDSD